MRENLIGADGEKLLSRFDRLAVAVSGGRDSMALLDWFATSGKYGGGFFVVHVNHNLRGQNSDADCALVKEYCDGKGIELLVYSEDVKGFCEKYGYGLEQGARLVRRKIFSDIVKSGRAQRVVTAHHLQDFSESVLMHVFRGSGIDGLCGIKEDDGMLIRPLLQTDRTEIERYVANRGVKYRDDESNSDTAYTRNFLRNEVLPLIKKRYPNLDGSLSALARQAGYAGSYIYGESASPELADGEAVLDAGALDQPEAVASSSIFKALGLIGARVDCECVHIEAVKSLKDKKSGARVCLPHFVEVERHKDKLYFYRKEEKDEGVYPFGEEVCRMGGYDVSVTAEKGDLTFDRDKIPEGAVIRTRRDGDRFRKFGGGEKSLGDYFTDKGIPLHRRDNVPLVAVGSEVLIVCGVEISDRVKVDKDTKNQRYISVRRRVTPGATTE